jgi:predicted XRE-type DNA-binding protein
MKPRDHHQEHEPRQFSESVAQEIRDRYERQGDLNQYELAEEYGVDQTLISHVVNRKGAYSEG